MNIKNIIAPLFALVLFWSCAEDDTGYPQTNTQQHTAAIHAIAAIRVVMLWVFMLASGDVVSRPSRVELRARPQRDDSQMAT